MIQWLASCNQSTLRWKRLLHNPMRMFLLRCRVNYHSLSFFSTFVSNKVHCQLDNRIYHLPAISLFAFFLSSLILWFLISECVNDYTKACSACSFIPLAANNHDVSQPQVCCCFYITGLGLGLGTNTWEKYVALKQLNVSLRSPTSCWLCLPFAGQVCTVGLSELFHWKQLPAASGNKAVYWTKK